MVIKVPSSNVRADMCSPDSLSLTSLVNTPQQQHYSSKSPHRKATKVSENDINFEFSYSAQSPAAVATLHHKSPSSDLFDLKLSRHSPAVPGSITMKDVLEPKKRARNKETRSATKKMSNQVGKYENGEDVNSGGFAHKLMQSITTPCRSCSAVEPSAVVKRTNAVQNI